VLFLLDFQNLSVFLAVESRRGRSGILGDKVLLYLLQHGHLLEYGLILGQDNGQQTLVWSHVVVPLL